MADPELGRIFEELLATSAKVKALSSDLQNAETTLKMAMFRMCAHLQKKVNGATLSFSAGGRDWTLKVPQDTDSRTMFALEAHSGTSVSSIASPVHTPLACAHSPRAHALTRPRTLSHTQSQSLVSLLGSRMSTHKSLAAFLSAGAKQCMEEELKKLAHLSLDEQQQRVSDTIERLDAEKAAHRTWVGYNSKNYCPVKPWKLAAEVRGRLAPHLTCTAGPRSQTPHSHILFVRAQVLAKRKLQGGSPAGDAIQGPSGSSGREVRAPHHTPRCARCAQTEEGQGVWGHAVCCMGAILREGECCMGAWGHGGMMGHAQTCTDMHRP
jgi:hypothetical protein